MSDLFGVEETEQGGAVFSPCMAYRYTLWRHWGKPMGERVMFIGLNPSTADEKADDPTIRRIIGFAKDWGFAGLMMTNIFAFRATDPKIMKTARNPIGELNDQHLTLCAYQHKTIIAAWGNDGSYRGRGKAVRDLIDNLGMRRGDPLQCLGLTTSGQPKHPLYLQKTTIPRPL